MSIPASYVLAVVYKDDDGNVKAATLNNMEGFAALHNGELYKADLVSIDTGKSISMLDDFRAVRKAVTSSLETHCPAAALERHAREAAARKARAEEKKAASPVV